MAEALHTVSHIKAVCVGLRQSTADPWVNAVAGAHLRLRSIWQQRPH